MAAGFIVIGFLAGMLMFAGALALSLPVWVALLAYMAGCSAAVAIVAAVRAHRLSETRLPGVSAGVSPFGRLRVRTAARPARFAWIGHFGWTRSGSGPEIGPEG